MVILVKPIEMITEVLRLFFPKTPYKRKKSSVHPRGAHVLDPHNPL